MSLDSWTIEDRLSWRTKGSASTKSSDSGARCVGSEALVFSSCEPPSKPSVSTAALPLPHVALEHIPWGQGARAVDATNVSFKTR